MSVTSAVEIERKYAVPDGAALPDLGAAGAVAAHPAVLLEALYVDTADRALLRAGIAVRRRRGGHDEGWHVKLRSAAGRVELHAPIDPADPDALPAAFARALRSRQRGRALEPLARIRTERHAVVVSDADGAAVEVVDDHVTAVDVAAGVERSWREWEAEQADDSPACAALLDRVDEALLGAGATPSSSPAKIAQALGQEGERPAPEPPATAGAVLAARMAVHVEGLHRAALHLALEPDPEGAAVHGLRKTIRRARSLLALQEVAGPAGRELSGRLREIGLLLGDARDPRVAAAVAADLLDAVDPASPGLAEARERLVTRPRTALQGLTAEVVDALGAAEVLAVVDALERFTPDGTDAAAPPERLRALAKDAVRRARRRAAAGMDGGTDDLHRARKAAKRARYVVEELAAAGLVGSGSGLVKAGRRAERVHDALGEHRDLALLLARLPAESVALTADGGNAFALGRLAENGERELALRLRRAQRAVRRLG
ncbi:CYTH domain-containing protein [Amnibacterium setariae]|nr:CHAD domain-containing protein [Amnibacterium setariae]